MKQTIKICWIRMERVAAWVLLCALLLSLFPAPTAQAAGASDTPVWKIAWIRVPEVKVQVGSELRTVTETTYTQDIIAAADLFEWYIEHYTNQAVDLRIDQLVVEVAPTYTSRKNDYIAITPRITPNMTIKNVSNNTYDVDISEYDSLIVSWPFGYSTNYNSPPGHEGAAGWAEDEPLEAYTCGGTFMQETPNTDVAKWAYLGTAIHEFLHLTEFWFRDELGFPLPYEVPDGVVVNPTSNDPDDRNALHNPRYYNYWVQSYAMREPLMLTNWFPNLYAANPNDYKFWFEDWLACRVPDPRSPGRMLGIPAEAWNYTPTNGLRPSNIGAVLVPSRYKGDSDYSVNSGSIDLGSETITLPSSYSVAAYSLDGGAKWKKGALPEGTKFQKLLDKGMTLWVTDKWNAKDVKEDGKVVDKKGVAKDASVIQFAKINSRPKANAEKLKPYYLSDTWEPRKAGTSVTSTVYVWANTTNKKTPDGEWQSLPANGFTMLTGKAKSTYLFRTPATASGSTYTPASKVFKLTPNNYSKAPNYKVKTDKKTSKQTIKLKAGDRYQIGTDPLVKVTAAKELDVTKLNETLTIWKGETGKKPASEKQTLELIGTVANGTVDDDNYTVIGDGSASNPYLITSEVDLSMVGRARYYPSGWRDACYLQTADIILTKSGWDDLMLGGFNGVYDGGGHTISNLFGSEGFIGINDGVIKNLGLVNVNINGSNDSFYCGAVALINNGLIQNCYVTGSVVFVAPNNSETAEVGGITGLNTNGGIVENCYVTASVKCNDTDADVGGIVGWNDNSTVRNCVALNMSVTGDFAGRVAGWHTGTLANNYALKTMGGSTEQFNSTAHNTQDGENVTAAEAKSASWWTASGRWIEIVPSSAWNFDSVWSVTDGSYPILRN